jgi:hypothetical protein
VVLVTVIFPGVEVWPYSIYRRDCQDFPQQFWAISQGRSDMKKRLMVLLILAVSLPLAGGALAAQFPAATVGFQWQNNPNVYTILTLKLNGTAKMASPMKFYTVSGITFDTTIAAAQYPVSGSAYVKVDLLGDKTLYFSLSGSLGAALEFIDLEGLIGEFNGAGAVVVRGSLDSNWGKPVWVPITALTADQIKALILPY